MNWKDDPSVQAMKKARADGGVDALQADSGPGILSPPRRPQGDANYAFPQLTGKLAVVDESAAIVEFDISSTATGDGTNLIDASASARNFVGMPLLDVSGQKVGTITAATSNGITIHVVADVNNTGTLERLLGGQYTGVNVTAQSTSRKTQVNLRIGTGTIHVVRPLSIRLVAIASDVNSDFNASKSFRIRNANNRIEKRYFGGSAEHAGTGRGSNLATQVNAFKKIHRGGAEALTGDDLSKLSKSYDSARVTLGRHRSDSDDDTVRAIKRARKKPKPWGSG